MCRFSFPLDAFPSPEARLRRWIALVRTHWTPLCPFGPYAMPRAFGPYRPTAPYAVNNNAGEPLKTAPRAGLEPLIPNLWKLVPPFGVAPECAGNCRRQAFGAFATQHDMVLYQLRPKRRGCGYHQRGFLFRALTATGRGRGRTGWDWPVCWSRSCW